VGIGGTTRDEQTEEEMLKGDAETATGEAGAQNNSQSETLILTSR
jgi:hypothetical protein